MEREHSIRTIKLAERDLQNRETNKVTDKNKVRARKNETLYIVSTESMQGARETAYEI